MSEIQTTPTAPEKAFSLEVLRKDSVKLFGITSATFDGAMMGKTQPMTIKAAKEAIEAWKKGVVK